MAKHDGTACPEGRGQCGHREAGVLETNGVSTCLLCKGRKAIPLGQVTDYWYTRESVTLFSCPTCGVAFIDPGALHRALTELLSTCLLRQLCSARGTRTT